MTERTLRALAIAVALGVAASTAGQDALAVALPFDGASALLASDPRMADLSARVASLETEQRRAESELVGLSEARVTAEARLRLRARALVRMTRAGSLPLAGGVSALLGHLARRERLERIVRRDIDDVRSLAERSGVLREASAQRAVELDHARDELSALTTQREQAAGMLLTGALSGSTGTPAAVPTPGRLGLPVASPTSMRQAQREEGPGIEFAAATGTPVVASDAGRVAFAQAHPAYGRLVVLEHGGGIFSVVGGLGTLAVTAGESVARGDELGRVGGDPVFYQVRNGTRPVDPRPWLGL